MKPNKKIYYFLNCTWGIVMTFIGWVAALVLQAAGYKPTKYKGCLHFEVGKNNWGGVSLGMTIITQKTDHIPKHAKERLLNHEFGHSLQNALLGPLMPFIVCIPSAMRYWYITFMLDINKEYAYDYDAVWFEGTATSWGNDIAERWD